MHFIYGGKLNEYDFEIIQARKSIIKDVNVYIYQYTNKFSFTNCVRKFYENESRCAKFLTDQQTYILLLQLLHS